jgi:hypothetical protein
MATRPLSFSPTDWKVSAWVRVLGMFVSLLS